MKLEHDNLFDTILKWKKFYLEVKNNNELSKHTYSQYNKVFNLFYEFIIEELDEDKSIKDIDKSIIIKFLNHKEWEASTKKNYLIFIKGFFQFISDENDSNYNFLKIFKNINIKVKKSIPIHLNNDEEEKVNTYCIDTFKLVEKKQISISNKVAIRNALLIYILLKSGIRVSEVLGLKVDDFILDNESNVYSFKVLGKGNKERIAYVPATIEKVFKYFINIQHSNIAFSSTNKDNLIDRAFLFIIVRKIFKSLNINKSGLHIMRHTLAMKLVAQNVNLSTISEILGHSDISITQIYARSNEESKKSALVGSFFS